MYLYIYRTILLGFYKKMIDEKLSMLLVPPGEGVLTIHTKKDKKNKLHEYLYGTQDSNKVNKLWLDELNKIEKSKIVLLGVCSDCGGGIQRGANWGPLFLRLSWLKNNKNLFDDGFIDIGDFPVIPHLLVDKYLNQETIDKCREALYGEGINNAIENDFPVSPLSICNYFLDRFYDLYPDKKVIALGGDHSVSYPLVKSLLETKGKNKRIGVIHFDAHTDLLDIRYGIDINFGSWAYHILSYLCDPGALIQVGIRSTGQDRSSWENKLGVKQYWAKEVNNIGVNGVVASILNNLSDLNIDSLYFSVDIDAIDSSEVSATGTPEKDGIFVDDVCNIIKLLGSKYDVLGADLVEVAPMVRHDDLSLNLGNINEPESTLNCGVKILNCFKEVF